MLRVAVLAAALALALPSAAHAQSPRDVMRDFGMLGTWARDCSKPSDRTNFYAMYVGTANGNVRRTHYNTPDRSSAYSEYIITRVNRLPANQLSYQQEGSVDRDQMDVILVKDGNRYKVLSSSVRATGEMLVKDGKYPQDGAESPWQSKCGG